MNKPLLTKGVQISGTVTGASASGAALTLTIPAVTGTYNYVTKIRIERFAAAALTASGTPITMTTNGFPGTFSSTFPTEAALQGTIFEKEFNFNDNPLRGALINTAQTITLPATTGVIWRATAFYYQSI